jgi:hypothetical protein
MVLMKVIFWLALYPLTVAGFILTSAWEVILFLFNSPIDVWNIIGRAFDDPESESAE